MRVHQLVPRVEEVDLEATLRPLRNGSAALQPFAPETMQFCANLSQALFRDSEAKAYPELQALAFWMRKSELEKLRQDFGHLETENTWLVPRGLVFHIPPANVDTIFMYSWLMSVLAGNRNLLRISPRTTPQTAIICRLFNQCLSGSGEALQHNTVMIQYGHESEITAAISAVADVRVIWGGDSAVNTLRSIPLPPHSKELTFPDRYSLSVSHAGTYLQLDDKGRRDLAAQFYNDMYWFDQMACSSPRLLIWCGDPKQCSEASAGFLRELREEVSRRSYVAEAAGAVNKFTFLCRSVLDQQVVAAQGVDSQLTVAQLKSIENLGREHCGGGFLYQYSCENLEEIATHIVRKDQTLSYFGFSETQLRNLVQQLNGRGIDRIVPVGKALTFGRYWDGYDLLQEMTRHVHVE